MRIDQQHYFANDKDLNPNVTPACPLTASGNSPSSAGQYILVTENGTLC
jgi:hypothetical protein